MHTVYWVILNIVTSVAASLITRLIVKNNYAKFTAAKETIKQVTKDLV